MNGLTIIIILSAIFLLYYVFFSRKFDKGTFDSMNYLKYPFLLKKSKATAAAIPKDSKIETQCRRVIENIFKRPFPKCRPQLLNNPVTKNNLEIDCFNEQLRLGFEVQGQQHYKFIPYFHKTWDKFRLQQYRDELKRRMCKDAGITLIEIPFNIKENKLKQYISEQVAAARPDIPINK